MIIMSRRRHLSCYWSYSINESDSIWCRRACVLLESLAFIANTTDMTMFIQHMYMLECLDRIIALVAEKGVCACAELLCRANGANTWRRTHRTASVLTNVIRPLANMLHKFTRTNTKKPTHTDKCYAFGQRAETSYGFSTRSYLANMRNIIGHSYLICLNKQDAHIQIQPHIRTYTKAYIPTEHLIRLHKSSSSSSSLCLSLSICSAIFE